MDFGEIKPKHLCLFIFNRASYSRCKLVIERVSRSQYFKLTVVLSNALLKEEYGNAQSYIRSTHDAVNFISLDLDDTETTVLGMAKASAQILDKAATLLHELKPDACIVVADRFETLPAAMAASYQNIPLVHIQGGEITGNIDEKVRHAVTKLSDYHMTATALSKDYVIAMGEHTNRVHNVGCPSLDVMYSGKIKRNRLKERYIICIFHPETENIEEAYSQTEILLNSVADFCRRNRARCYWFWPNPDPGRENIIKLIEAAHKEFPAIFIKAINKEPEAFLTQLSGARFIIGNSSCLIREASYLGVPAINVGDRQRLRERSWNVVDVGYDEEKLKDTMVEQDNVGRYGKSFLYGSGKASFTILERLKNCEFTLKPSLQYPMRMPFKERHLGEFRFNEHKQGAQKKRKGP
jgi:UDP-hydrolysing UDP-N-acetyl-D-glucosamine 2-epimerase